MDRQSPKCWAETLKMSPQVTNNDTAIWEVIFSTWYPGKVSLSAAQRSRSNNQGSISPQTPSTATGAHKANNHRNWFLSHCAWTGRKKPDPGNACYKVPDTLWHELNRLGSHFFLRQMAPSLSWIMPSLCPFTNSLILCKLPNITHWTPNTWYDGLGWHCSEKDLSGVLPRAEPRVSHTHKKDASSSFQHSYSARSYSSIQKVFGATHIDCIRQIRK